MLAQPAFVLSANVDLQLAQVDFRQAPEMHLQSFSKAPFICFCASDLCPAAGDISIPNSRLQTQQVSLMKAGSALDGSQDQVLGRLGGRISGTAVSLSLSAADGAAGAPGGTSMQPSAR